MIQLSYEEWGKSAFALCYQITELSHRQNLLSKTAQERGEYMFSDFGVPLPRPCTILAWASLCEFGPANGVVDAVSGKRIPFTIGEGLFLVPFLPKILPNEDTNLSLNRSSKLHEKNAFNQIRWGNVYIGDAKTGALVEQLQHGNRNAKEWFDSKNNTRIIDVSVGQSRVPPLFADQNDRWQFGIIQNLPMAAISLRDSMIELARHGIPISLRFPVAPVSRLLIRFLEQTAVQKWAEAYASAIRKAEESRNDFSKLVDEIIEARESEKDPKKEKSKFDREAVESALEDYSSLMDALTR